jgi:hypothetical protein
MRNILDHLPERQRTWAKAILQRAYRSGDVATARRLLLDLARRLETDHPSAAESLISRTRHVKRSVKRWRGGLMVVRWVAAGVLEAVKGFSSIEGAQGDAAARRGLAGAGSAARDRYDSGKSRVKG